MQTKATYVSVWDGGNSTVMTDCTYDTVTNTVDNVEMAEVDHADLDCLDKEYILLPDGTEIPVENLAETPY